MAEETERRFLVRSDEWKRSNPERSTYLQGYLSLDPERSVRVRSMGEKAAITIKSQRNGDTRQEFEYSIPPNDCRQILDRLCVKPLINKTRYKIHQNGKTWEIDEYANENAGLLIAETELKSKNQSIRKPPWVGDEISDDRRFDNTNLVAHPFTTWAHRTPSAESHFHLKNSEAISKGISRSITEQLTNAESVLLQTTNTEEAIHEARKCLKKTRSILRLSRSVLADTYGTLNSELRDLGRRLSPVRDAAALAEAAADFENSVNKATDKGVVRRFSRELQNRKSAIESELLAAGEKQKIAEAIQQLIAAAGTWPLEKIDLQVVTQGLKATLSRGRAVLKVAAGSYDPNDFHELRKRAKDLRYQVHFLYKLWPQVFDGYSESAKELEQLLGDDHNLTVMQDLVKEIHFDARATALLRSIIKGRQENLRAKALQAGRLLYSEKWATWARRLKKCSQLMR